jgi:valyl-tRNA synthetase
MREIPKAYDQSKEPDIYKLWELSGYFNPDNLQGEPFTVIMPPPNVTGTLHVGHALGITLQDLMIRFERMRGKKALWLPGTDHAAIATQAKVEAILYKEEEKSKHDLGREEFLKKVEGFAAQSHKTIISQMKSMGASADWSREAYTLDPKRSLAVRTGFKRMYDAGLIYQGDRIVNWDPKLQTTVSDEEIEWKDEVTQLYYLKYGPFTIATARPETKFGDKYVVMHPNDERYKDYQHGQQMEVEWINGPITATIIKDDAIDMEFGTGVMTITPWHDATDYEIAERHKLNYEQIIDERGLLLPVAGEFKGLHIKKARPQIVDKLSHKGLVEKIDMGYHHRIATNSRGGGMIEPQIKKQWWMDMDKEFTLKESKIKGVEPGQPITFKKLLGHVVESGLINVIPDEQKKIYLNFWVANLHDWCISRQLWYGHRIPVWYKDDQVHCDVNPPEGNGWEQDPDTLDTWFSSGMWTFSTLGWPDQTDDLKTFHPTDVLETGKDILFFWVIRMILMSGYLVGDIPFKTVYMHGMVRDENKKKMSKSLGNIIDPLEMTKKYGVDALRMSQLVGVLPGVDLALSDDKVRGYRNFANKIWNAARFVYQNTDDYSLEDNTKLSEDDQKVVEETNALAAEVTKLMEGFDYAHAAENLYHFFWHRFADEIIEQSKAKLADDATKKSAQKMLITILETQLKLLHPFTPFVTESVWQLNHSQMLMIEPWPVK